MKSSRIAVTGVGIVSALGRTAEETFDRLCRGDRAFGQIPLFDTAGQRTGLGAFVPDFDPADVATRPGEAPWSRSDALALVAATDALRGAGLDPGGRSRLGVSVGITTAGMLEAETRLGSSPGGDSSGAASTFVSYPLSSTATRLSAALGPAARVATLCSACSSSANSIIQGVTWLRLGAADVVLAGGTDALCRLTLTGFNALGATDVVPCRPFDAARGGLTLGEGAAFLVLESEEHARARGATPLAWLSGFAAGSEAHHITQPDPTGRLPAELLRRALAMAELGPTDLDYVNAHGTGTQSNDAVETLAIRAALGDEADRVWVSSSKGQLGHTLGASAAIEAAITVLAVARGVVPPTGGLESPDPACRLRHVLGQGRPAQLRGAASNAFGFGGSGAVLLFEHESTARRSRAPGAPSRVVIAAAATTDARGPLTSDACAVHVAPEAPPLDPGSTFSPAEHLDPARSRRFGELASLVTSGAEACLRAAALPGGAVGLVTATAFGDVARTVSFLRAALEKGPRRVPPAEFPHLVPSAPSANAAIYLGLSGPVLTTSALEVGAESAVSIAADWIEAGIADAVVAGGAEAHDPFVAELLGPVCEGAPVAPRTEGAAFVALEREDAALARGARPAAVLLGRYEAPWDATGGLAGVLPAPASRAVVVAAREGDRLSALLERIGWSGAARFTTSGAVGFHEAAGGFALAAAAALIARGQASEALVVGLGGPRVVVLHLGAPS